MSQHKKPRRSTFFQPRLELLEERAVPAGNITAAVINGVLTIRSDNDFHEFQVSCTGKTSVMIRVFAGTTINGTTDNTPFRGITRGYDIQTGNGPDAVIMDDVHANDFMSIVTNGGNDAVYLLPGTYVTNSTQIRTGDGDDYVYISGSTVNRLALDTGAGDDGVNIANSYTSTSESLEGGTGSNTLGMSNNNFRRQAAVYDFQSQFPVLLAQTGPDGATVSEGGTTSINVIANDAAVVGSLNPASVTIVSPPLHGTATVNSDGSISYTNDGSSSTSDTFGYTVSNTLGGTSSVGTVTITVTAVTPTGPTTTITSSVTSPTKTTPIPYTVNFSAAVTGFTESDITVTNGTASAFTAVSATQYTFSVTPTADGTVNVSIPAGVATNSAGTGNLASNTLAITYDSTAPTITINTLTTNKTTPTITGTVNDSTATISVSVDGQTATGTISGTTWSATLGTALADGTYTITATATDPAGNVGTATSTNGLIIDTVAPTAAITSTASDPTTTAPIPVTVTFSKDVTGFAASDVTVTNGTVTNFASTSATTYTFNVTLNAAGTVTVNVPASSAQDAAGNGNTAATPFTITFNGTLTSVALTSTVSGTTNVSPIPFTATFSGAVTGFTSSGISVTNGTVTNFASTNASTYTFDVVPSGDGTVTVNVDADAAQDSSGNGNSVGTPISITFDGTLPTVSLTTTAANPTNVSPIPVTATFSEAVTGFTSSSPTITNGSISNFVAVSSTVYTFDVTPTGNGAVIVNVAADLAHDSANNGNPAATPLSVTYDNVAPTVALTTTATSPTNLTSIPVTATFSEPVNGFVNGVVTVTNGTINDFTTVSTTVYTFNVLPTANGVVTVNVAAGVAKDAAGNGNTAATPLDITYDNVAPTPTISSTLTSPTSSSPLPITVKFSEAVTGFTASGVTLTNGTLSDFASTDAETYTFKVTPDADGTVTVNVPANVTQDAAGNGNAAATQLNITFNGTLPSVTLTTTANNPTNVKPIPVTATFSEDVTGFASADVTVTNGTLSDFTAVSGSTYSFNVTPMADGAVSVNVAANVATDTAGNGNTAATPLSITFDSTAPSVSMTSTLTNPTATSPIPVTAKFSEDVSGFTVAGLTATNGTISNFDAVSANTYTFDVTPTADGLVTVDLAADSAHDAAGNNNSAAVFRIEYGATDPAVVLTTTASNPTRFSPIPVTATFSKDVTGFSDTSPTVTNGTISDFTAVSATVYTFNVTPASEGAVTIEVPADAAQDSSSNGNLASDPLSITYDITAPTDTINPVTTNQSKPTLTGTVSEAGASVVVTVNGIGATATVTGTDWSATLGTALPDGTYDISTTTSDAAGNESANTLTGGLVINTVAPTATISATSVTSPTNANPIPIKITFSEDVTGFAAGEIAVTNGTLSNFDAVDAEDYTFDVAPTADGTVTVSVPADAATDSAGNGNTAPAPFSIVSDTTPPTPTLQYSGTSPTNTSPIPLSVDFGEVVTGFDASKVSVTNGTISNFSSVDGRTYTFQVTPAAEGDVTVAIAAGAATDTAGNASNAATNLVVTYDPTVATIDAASTGAITGTATDAGSGVTGVQLSIYNNSSYWDGTGFNSSTETFFAATSSNDFANWSYTFTTPGTYTVHAQITNGNGLVTNLTKTVSVS